MTANPSGTVSEVQCRDGSAGAQLNAVIAGLDNVSGPQYVARFGVEQKLASGKVAQVHRQACIPCCQKKITSTEYEVLHCKGKVSWVPASDGRVPPGALVTGRASNQSPLCPCASYNTTAVDEVHPTCETAFIPYEDREE